jgi:hypothetical protein
LLWTGGSLLIVISRLPVNTDVENHMNTLWQDLRYGARMLSKRPGFTLIAALTLSLGLGANTAAFSLLNSFLLRPLPCSEPERLAGFYRRGERPESIR